MSSTATLIHADVRSASLMVDAILPNRKGREHIMVLAGSHVYDKSSLYLKRRGMKAIALKLGIPYSLYFFHGGPGLVCWWEFDDASLAKEKAWFDRNAALGRYPHVPHKRSNEEKEDEDLV